MTNNSRKFGQGFESLERRDLLTSVPFGASSQDVAEFLLGDVTVNVVFLESDGSRDPSTEDWNTEQIEEVKAEIEKGVNWWSDTLAEYSDVHTLNFNFDYTYADNPLEISYEPIARKSQDFQLWIEEFFREVGVASSSGFSTEIREFNHQQRIAHDTNWSFTIFVANAENDADNRFATGSEFTRAFAYPGGQFFVMPHSRPEATIAHELAHIFWAFDEYSSGDAYYASRGYYNTQNTNGRNGNPDLSTHDPQSIMLTTTSSATGPYANHKVSQSGRETLGWLDSDGDGIFDVLDVDHSISGSVTFDESTRVARFIGESSVETLDNKNPSGSRNDITINRLTDLQYRLDQGEWQSLMSLNDYQVSINAVTPKIPIGVSSIEFRTIDGRIGVTSAAVSATIDPGVDVVQNPDNPLDVTGDGFVSPVDALRLIVALNDGVTALTVGPPFYDVTGDGHLSPADALSVISHLNIQASILGAQVSPQPVIAQETVVNSPSVIETTAVRSRPAVLSFEPIIVSADNDAEDEEEDSLPAETQTVTVQPIAVFMARNVRSLT